MPYDLDQIIEYCPWATCLPPNAVIAFWHLYGKPEFGREDAAWITLRDTPHSIDVSCYEYDPKYNGDMTPRWEVAIYTDTGPGEMDKWPDPNKSYYTESQLDMILLIIKLAWEHYDDVRPS